MEEYKKVSLDELYNYLAKTFTKLHHEIYIQYASDWMDEMRTFEQNAIYDEYGKLHIYDNLFYNKKGESERLTIAFRYIYFDDGTVDTEYYLPKSVNL